MSKQDREVAIPLCIKNILFRMGDGFIRFVEDGTGAKYVRFGTRCGVCDRRLGFFATGFWSTNTQQLADGPLCPVCSERVKKLIVEKQEWMSPEQKKDPKWKQYKKTNWHLMSLADAKELFTQKEANDADRLNEYADGAKALFRVRESFAIEPNALQVGSKRAKQLKEKTVVFWYRRRGLFPQRGCRQDRSQRHLVEVIRIGDIRF